MNTQDRLLSECKSNLVGAVGLLCTFIDLDGEPRLWDVMYDASELLGGLTHRHASLRKLVTVHLEEQFSCVRNLASQVSASTVFDRDLPSFVATACALLNTTGLVGPRDWIASYDLESLWEDLCCIVSRRNWAVEKLLPYFIACYSDYACPQTRNALRDLAADEQILERVRLDPAVGGQLAAAALTQGLSIPHLCTNHWCREELTAFRSGTSLLDEDRRQAAIRVSRALGVPSRSNGLD